MRFTKVLIMAFVAVLLSACNPPVESSHSLKDSRVVVQTPDLYHWVQMDFINQIRHKDGLLEFEARFTNVTSYQQENLNYRIDWFDENGFLIKTILSNWKTVHFTPSGSISVKGIAPNPKAINYQIRLRQDDSVSGQTTTEI